LKRTARPRRRFSLFPSRRVKVLGPAAFFAFGITGLGYAWRRFVRRPLPATSGVIRLKGLARPVEIIRDHWGVPHIYAQSEADLFFAQGYTHAQDRLFQMDGFRRVGLGRVSEVVGPLGLASDRFARNFGWPRAAAALVEGIRGDPASLAVAEAYAAGVNAFIGQGRLPVEYAVLALKPEPWTILDSAAWGTVMAWGLSCNWETELMRAWLIEQLGADKAADLTPTYADDYPTILPAERVGGRLAEAMLRAYHAATDYLALGELPAGPGVGSNNWVVNGQWSVSGRPVLANDPHLPPIFPTLWYENHLAGGGYNVAGFTMPGLPGVIIGHNERIAWGITNAFPDIQDIYIERFHPDDPTRYEVEGRWVKAEVIEERIRVRGRAPVVEKVTYTRHGPVISGLLPGENRALALRWSCHESHNHLRALRECNRATDWPSFREALRHWGFPSQNVVYADVDGNVGYVMPGKVPLRAAGDGLVAVPGWTNQYEWSGWIPYEELPAILNPLDGVVVTANNQVVGDGYPYLLTSEWLAHHRANRILERLKELAPLSLEAHGRIQNDTVSQLARRFLPLVLPLLETEGSRASPAGQRALRLLREWDGDASAGSVAASICYALLIIFTGAVFKQAAGPMAAPLLGSSGNEEFRTNPFHEMAYELVVRWLEQGAPAWVGDILPLLEPAFANSLKELRRALGPDMARWQWGRLHQVRFQHPLARLPGLGRLWKPMRFPAAGDGHSVNQSDFPPHFPPEPARVIASCRMLLDVGEWDNSLAALPGGQSGHLASPHYQDGIRPWLEGRYHPMLFSRQRVEEAAVAWLSLTPFA
jgi:penicillin amidase